jgi:hypothetical protein
MDGDPVEEIMHEIRADCTVNALVTNGFSVTVDSFSVGDSQNSISFEVFAHFRSRFMTRGRSKG